uniref:Uncharacterized protein n=1 Tax=Micrurus surinamensis TaxID=129470 RepID=A0A2D4PYB7_MICSU
MRWKGMTETGWSSQRELKWTPEDGRGQEGLEERYPWGRDRSDTTLQLTTKVSWSDSPETYLVIITLVISKHFSDFNTHLDGGLTRTRNNYARLGSCRRHWQAGRVCN